MRTKCHENNYTVCERFYISNLPGHASAMATAVFLATLAHFLNEPISQVNHLVNILKFEVYNNHNVIACGEQCVAAYSMKTVGFSEALQQWNLSTTDTIGAKLFVLMSEVSLFYGG